MEKQNELLPGGCLTIVCNLEIFYSDRTTQGKKKPRLDFSPPTETNSTLGDQLSDVFSHGDFSGMSQCSKIGKKCKETLFAYSKMAKNQFFAP